MSLGIPIKLLHESVNFIVTIELNSGDSYRGILKMIEENMNCWLHEVIHTEPNGYQTKSDSVYLRGSNILFIEVPELLTNSTLFQTGENSKKNLGFKKKPKRTFTSVTVRKQSK